MTIPARRMIGNKTLILNEEKSVGGQISRGKRGVSQK